jgi:hypothetical protein
MGIITISIDTYKPNGVFEKISYSKMANSKIRIKEFYVGTWSISNKILSRKYNTSGKWEKTIEAIKWGEIKVFGGRSSFKAKIIKLPTDNLITVNRSEADYIPLKSTKLNYVLSSLKIEELVQ